MNFEQLKNLIFADTELSLLAGQPGPLGDYPDSQDGTIAAQLNAQTLSRLSIVKSAALSVWAARTGVRAAIEDHAADAQSPLRSSALALRDLLRGNLSTGLDLSNPDNIIMLNAWESVGAITAEAKGQLVQLALVPCSRAEIEFGTHITSNDVASALGRTGPGWR